MSDFPMSGVGIPQPGVISKKPPFLVTLEPAGKTKTLLHFIAIDRPEMQAGYIQAKGVYTELAEDELVKAYTDVLASTPKESILEMIFPWHRVVSIRSLVFNAHKPAMPIKRGHD